LEETNKRVEETVQGIIRENPKAVVITLGGEHSVSYSPIKVLAEKHKNLQVAHFDAHPDLMDDYLGEKWSHATVMRRVHELGIAVTQFGIRAGTDDERALMEKLPKKLDLKKPTYISIDMDVFDPGICPGVGTPEPGGMAFKEVMSILSNIKNVVGFDIVEANPLFDKGDITSVTAAKVMLQLILSR
jgi:agmatinase